MRIVVTGRTGQIVRALIERGAKNSELTILPVGRPVLDLAEPDDVVSLFDELKPDVVVNSAAYTAVDQAESEPDQAMAINGRGAGAVATAARAVGAPIIQLSTDYVFDGTKAGPYVETDQVGPISVYGRSKLAGENAVASAHPDHVILRTAWVYAAEGKNFFLTMLRLAATRPEVAVVADQRGCPSYAADIADIIFTIARRLTVEPDRSDLRGIFHVSGSGETDWAGFAEKIFCESSRHGGPSAVVRRIATNDYPTPAIRPANSRLDCTKLRSLYGVAMPDWQDATSRCISQMFQGDERVRT